MWIIIKIFKQKNLIVSNETFLNHFNDLGDKTVMNLHIIQRINKLRLFIST